MKQLRPLIIIAIVANLLTFILYNYAAIQPGGSGVALIFALVWMPALWSATIITTIVITIIKRKHLFQKFIVRWTFPILLFTAPLPAIAVYYGVHPTPETRSSGTMINIIEGKVYKTEFWERTGNHKKFAHKRFIADSAQGAKYGDKAFKKDSTWVYFDNNGDTSKLEYYKNDKLMDEAEVDQR